MRPYKKFIQISSLFALMGLLSNCGFEVGEQDCSPFPYLQTDVTKVEYIKSGKTVTITPGDPAIIVVNTGTQICTLNPANETMVSNILTILVTLTYCGPSGESATLYAEDSTAQVSYDSPSDETCVISNGWDAFDDQLYGAYEAAVNFGNCL